MNLLQRLQVHVLLRMLNMPHAAARRFAGPPAVSEGVELDFRTQLFCKLASYRNPTSVRDPSKLPALRIEQDQLAPMVYGKIPAHLQITRFHIPLEGRVLEAELLRPAHTDLPPLVWFHGGGFAIGSLHTHRGGLARLAHRARCPIVHVAYRLAPEHRFPHGHDDARDAYAWLLRHGAELGVETTQLAVGGDSAGACLATALCTDRAEAGLEVPPLQVLVYPPADVELEPPSFEAFAEGFFLTRANVRQYTKMLVRTPADRVHPRISPLRRRSLVGTSRTVLVTAGFDVLRDEGRLYGERLRQDGVHVDELNLPYTIHGFLNFCGLLEASRRATDEVADAVRQALVQVSRGATGTPSTP